MNNISLKLTGVFVALLLIAVATNANAQNQAKSSYIYGITPDGKLMWYRHVGADRGLGLETTGSWQGANEVGHGWNGFASVFAGGSNIMYAIRSDGTLDWRQHQGARTGLPEWGASKVVGRGWNGFRQVFSGGGGILYVIEAGGKLRWYRHNGYQTGAGFETPGAWEGPREVGRGWASFKQVFSGGNGIIYAITPDGKLLWYKHNGYQTGTGLETPGSWEGPRDVGRGWANFTKAFSAGDGVIYAITEDGKLIWYKHNGYLDGRGLESAGAWENPKEVGHGWGKFDEVFALLPGSAPVVPSSSSSTSVGNIGGDSFDKPKRTHDMQPENSIRVSVRYKQEFGYLGTSNAFGEIGPTSCDAFLVSVVAGDGRAQSTLIQISTDFKMALMNGYYVCNYLVSDLPLNQPIRLSVRLTGFDPAVPWKGGSQSQPPPGQQRTIIIVSGRDTGPLQLTSTQSRAQQLYEMVYTQQPR